jgi:phosphomannomutase/phosphoglucomutase
MYPVSRAVHLARLASFYPKCRECLHGDDTGTHASRLVRLLVQTRSRSRAPSLFTDDGVRGVYLNTLTASQTRELAAAFALALPSDDSGQPGVCDDLIVAGDGRPLTSELVAAACEGVRWTNRRVIDLGAATAPSVVWAVDHLRAAGGLLIGNTGEGRQTIHIKFWGRDGRPFSTASELGRMRSMYEANVDRPSRSYGQLGRFRADESYLAGLQDHFHALRPLRFVLDTGCRPVMDYLQSLSYESACDVVQDQLIGSPAATHRGLAERVRRSGAHFGIWIDGDGEACRLIDERGRDVRHDQWLWLTVQHWLELGAGPVFVFEHGVNATVAGWITAQGGRVHFSDPGRAAMYDLMREHLATAGGGPSGRLWFGGASPAPDALRALALLLTILSRSDRRLSEAVETGQRGDEMMR